MTPKEERIASFYARRIISEKAGTVIAKLTEDSVFNKNFWTDFKKYLTPEHRRIFKDFNKLDFSQIVERLEELKELDKQLSDEEKLAKKVKTAERKQDYGYAIINGVKEPVGNFTIEPAAIFYGRGANPKRGKIKRDIEPEEVTINVQEGVQVKPPPGHKWKQVINDHKAAWIANWKDPISNENKYVYLGAEGQLKGKSDYIKYEKARKLNKYLDKVREKYGKDINSKVQKLRQLGTVLYLIDHYGLRVGNEKDESETDTVGASTLRVEHIKLKPPSMVIFDFLGKDSIRYYKELQVEPAVYANISGFLKGKKPSDPLFDLVSATDINNYLKTFDKDFSAKVFRTRLASTIMDAALKELKIKKNATADEKKKLFTKANIKVAEILNHQRTVSAKAKDTIKKYEEDLKDLKKQLKEAKDAGKSTKSLETRIQKKKDQIENKKDTLNVAVTTSLTNYIDPRLVVAWLKENEVTIPKVYTATLQRKFKWAIDMTEPDWSYSDTELLPVMAKLQPVTETAKTTTTTTTTVKEPVKTKAVVPKKTTAIKPVAPKKITQVISAVPAKPVALKKITLVVYDPTKSSIIGIYNRTSDLDAIRNDLGNATILKVPLNDFFNGIDDTLIYQNPNYLLEGKITEYQSQPSPNNNNIFVVYDQDIKNITGVYTSRKEAETELFSDSAIIVEIPVNKLFSEGIDETKLYQNPSYLLEKEITIKKPDGGGVSIIDYTDKSFVVIGDTKPFKDQLSALYGKYNPALTINGKKTAGWIFSKKRLDQVSKLLGIPSTPKSVAELSFNSLGDTERAIIKCFARDPQIVEYLKEDLSSGKLSHPVYTDEFLQRFIKCMTTEPLKDNQTRQELIDSILSGLEPASIPTYLLIVYLLQKSPENLRKEYLQTLLARVQDKEGVEKCLITN